MKYRIFACFMVLGSIWSRASAQTAFSDAKSYVSINCPCDQSIGSIEHRMVCNQEWVVELPIDWCPEPGNTILMKQLGCGWVFTFRGIAVKTGPTDAPLPKGRKPSPKIFRCTVLAYPYEW